MSFHQLWERFRSAIPEHVLSQPEEKQAEYFERLFSAYQRRHARDRAARDAEAFRIIDEYRAFIRRYYKPKRPDMFHFDKKWVHPDFLSLSELPSGGRELPPQVRDLTGQRQLFQLRVFTTEWCELLMEESRHFETWADSVGLHVNRPNSMNNFGVILDDFGFGEFFDRFTEDCMKRLAPRLFGTSMGMASLDSHHAFMVAYAESDGRDKELAFHVDDSELTLNLCLGSSFTGGELYFRGVRCPRYQQTPAYPDERHEYIHRVGWALLHVGRHRHGALPLSSGVRSNLVLWCRSSSFRENLDPSLPQPWCGAVQRMRADGAMPNPSATAPLASPAAAMGAGAASGGGVGVSVSVPSSAPVSVMRAGAEAAAAGFMAGEPTADSPTAEGCVQVHNQVGITAMGQQEQPAAGTGLDGAT